MTTLRNSDFNAAHTAALEEQRVQLQAELDAGRSQAERNRLGQFATPPALAREILDIAGKLLGQRLVRFLDPAFGTGAFYYALLASLSRDHLVAAEGYEVDPYYGLPAQHLWDRSGVVFHLDDFTRAQAPTSENDRFNLIVCNPPYVRHHHLAVTDKERLRALCQHVSGLRADGLGGLYCYFLVLSHDWLAENGLAIWLIPSEFMDVNYGSWVKRYLTERVTLLRIHRFDPNEVQFGDALVSSAVVCFRKTPPSADHEVEFSFGGSLNKPRLTGSFSLTALRHEKKWTRFPARKQRKAGGYILGDFFAIKRGLATGDNSYFILTAAGGRELESARRFLRPILPSPRYVTGNEILADQQGDPIINPQLFLLDCRLPEEAVRQSHPALWRYFEQGKERGLASRYLCLHRNPWYSQEERPAAPIVVTYMGRGDNATGNPFRFIRNRSNATAANVYLLMYPQGALSLAIHSRPELIDQVWAMLSRLDPQTLRDEGRVYGGGLHKLEPKELANVPADDIAALLDLPPKRAGIQMELIAR